MSEEIRRDKALDDAAMENVSGGINQKSAENAAAYVCSYCNASGPTPCKGSREKLAAHMMEIGYTFINNMDCPFYPW